MNQLPFIPGQSYNRRQDINLKYGGNWQSGISSSSTYPYIFIFSSRVGHKHGYEDLWLNDSVFRYTGEGQIGNMSFSRGNQSLKDHIINEKRVFLFERSGRNSLFVFSGELELLNYDYLVLPDTNGNERLTIQFFFKLLGKSDYVPLALLQKPLFVEEGESMYKVKIPNKTERKGLVTSRVGQGAYRKSIIYRWEYKCAVTGFDNLDVLIASHILPWAYSSDEQRLDVYNGLLLSPNYDALFDKHLISFENNGRIILSDAIQREAYLKLGITGSERINKLKEPNFEYLEHHRNLFYK